jgi:hypothetical protein
MLWAIATGHSMRDGVLAEFVHWVPIDNLISHVLKYSPKFYLCVSVDIRVYLRFNSFPFLARTLNIGGSNGELRQ